MSRRSAVAAAGLFAGVLCLALIFTRRSPESYDAQIMYQVAQSLVDHGNFLVHRDPFAINSPYSYYGIGMSAFMAVPYWLAEHLRQDPPVWAMSVNALVAAAIAVVLLALGRAAGATLRQALAAAAFTALGTLLFAYVATGFSEPSVGLAIALGLLGIQRGSPLLTGAAAGLALLLRIDSILLVAPFLAAAAWFAGGRSWPPLLRFALGLAPAILITGAYDALRFGAPWRTGYGFAVFNHPLLAGVYGLLFSPAAGLFIFVPLVPLALVGLFLALRRLPLLAATALVLLAIRIPVYAVWFGWSAYWAWGPRYLVPAMPVLAVGLMEIFRRWSGLGLLVKAGAAALIALSAAVQLVGAAVAYEHAAMFAALLRAHPPITGRAFILDESKPSTEAVFDRVDFDWSLWPIPDEAGDLVHGRHLAGHLLAPSPDHPAIAGLLVLACSGWSAALLAARPRQD